jgi:hypothetical protein
MVRRLTTGYRATLCGADTTLQAKVTGPERLDTVAQLVDLAGAVTGGHGE